MGREGDLTKGAQGILKSGYACLPVHHRSSRLWATTPLSPPGSVKFISKIQYVHSLEDLEQLIPMEHVQIPDCVLQ